MGIEKQAKILTQTQISLVTLYLASGRNGERNLVIFLLSVKGGLRAKEIANLTWKMILNSNGDIGDVIQLTNHASKGKSGRVIPINKELKKALAAYFKVESNKWSFNENSRVVKTERAHETSPQVIVNMFMSWYEKLGFIGCSSHSGRRTFITSAARKISLVGGSLRDVQLLAGHSNLQTTQRYIDYDTKAQRKVVDII